MRSEATNEWCARQDLNLRLPGPQPGVLSGLNYGRTIFKRAAWYVPSGRPEKGSIHPYAKQHGIKDVSSFVRSEAPPSVMRRAAAFVFRILRGTIDQWGASNSLCSACASEDCTVPLRRGLCSGRVYSLPSCREATARSVLLICWGYLAFQPFFQRQ